MVKPLLLWRHDDERSIMLFPTSENRLLPWDATPGPRVNTTCFLISPETELPLCLLEFIPKFQLCQILHSKALKHFLSFLCHPRQYFMTSPTTIIRSTVPSHLPECMLRMYATDLHTQKSTCASLIIFCFRESGFTASSCFWIPVFL